MTLDKLAFAVDISSGITNEWFLKAKNDIKLTLSTDGFRAARLVNFDTDICRKTDITENTMAAIDRHFLSGGIGGGTDITPVTNELAVDEHLVVYTDGNLYSYDTLIAIKDRVTLVLFDEPSAELREYVYSIGFYQVIVL